MRRLLKRLALLLGLILALALCIALIAGVWLCSSLRNSLPVLDGRAVLHGLSSPVAIERDDLGVPWVRGATRLDVARATGFLHAQERFFQMDLLRRKAAGELSALIGPATLAADRELRVHRFRARARGIVESSSARDRELLAAYTEGVNAGLHALGEKPPEYLLLRTEPEPWTAEDTILVVQSMYLELQGDDAARESSLGVLYDVLPPRLADFLAPRGTRWDAPLEGEPLPEPAIPGAEVVDLRLGRPAPPVPGAEQGLAPPSGSNVWAVAGRWTADGGALLANDMHLGLSLPNIWYRASLRYFDERGEERNVTGVTLPGAPAMIVGSNERVAWGFANGEIDGTDLVVLEQEPNDPDRYLTPDGPRRFERHAESIGVRGAAPEPLEVTETIWGPQIDRDHLGRPRALRWIAYDGGAVDLGLVRMEQAVDLESALSTANLAGMPTQSVVVADREGRVGWTLMGPIAERSGFDGRLPASWADGRRRWRGRLDASEYPRIVDGRDGRVWAANNRVGGGERLERLGDGGYDLGARARQIRDGLNGAASLTAKDMLALQLDDRALFLEHWRALLLDALTPAALSARPGRQELRNLVDQGWTGHASVDSVGYRIVRTFRMMLAQQVLEALTAPCKAADPRFNVFHSTQWEAPLWKLVSERPPHLVDPRRGSWEAQILAAVDATLDHLLLADRSALDRRTWGERNRVRLGHPLTLAVPQLGRWLDFAPFELPGDRDMPRVQGPSFGASMRMVVSPGHEDQGWLHMPGGQSGHFLSPYYKRGNDAWVRGEPLRFLPGRPVHRLTLVP